MPADDPVPPRMHEVIGLAGGVAKRIAKELRVEACTKRGVRPRELFRLRRHADGMEIRMAP